MTNSKTYQSASQGTVIIASMNEYHLVNAIRKQAGLPSVRLEDAFAATNELRNLVETVNANDNQTLADLLEGASNLIATANA